MRTAEHRQKVRDFSTEPYNKLNKKSIRPWHFMNRGRCLVTSIYATAALLLTPTLSIANQFHYDSIIEQLKSLKRNKSISVRQIGTSVQNRPIYAATITNLKSTDIEKKVRVIVLSGQHGDEQEPVYAALNMLDNFADSKNDTYSMILDRAIVVFVPVVNPDGFVTSKRCNGAGIDLNRNWNSADQPETKAVTQLVNEFRPHVLIDEHEWVKDDPYKPNCIEVAEDGDRPEYKLARLMAQLPSINKSERSFSMPPIYYGSTCDRRLAHRWFAQGGICSLLVETAPSNSNATRQLAYEDVTMAILSKLASNDGSAISTTLNSLMAKRPSSCAWVKPQCAKSTQKKRNPITPEHAAPYLVLLSAIGFLLKRSKLCRQRLAVGSEVLADMRLHSHNLTLSETVQSDLPMHMRLDIIHKYRVRPSDRHSNDSKSLRTGNSEIRR